MKIEAKAGPSIPFIDKPGAASIAAKENRQRAIEAFSRGAAVHQDAPAPQAQNQPVMDPSRVSPGEMPHLRSVASQNTQSEETHTIEEQEATSPPPAKVEEPLSPHYATLARKEKALRAEVHKLNAAKAAFKAEQEALKAAGVSAPTPTFDESRYISKDRATQDPVAVFEELGFTPDDLAQRLLNPVKSDPQVMNLVSQLKAEIAQLKASQDETKKTIESSQSDAYNQAITAMTYEAEELVNSDPEFQTIKETGQAGEIVNLIKDVHEKGLPGKYRKGTLLSVEQAARLVEDELVNQWVEQYGKLSRVEKIQKRLRPATPDAKPGQLPQGTQAQNQPAAQTRTLTNSMGTAGKLSARQRAIAVFNGQKS